MKKIAIIGCGISGLYLANLLEKSLDYDYKIFEKKSEINLSTGYGIQLSVNCVKLLNEIGFQSISKNEIFFPKKDNQKLRPVWKKYSVPSTLFGFGSKVLG